MMIILIVAISWTENILQKKSFKILSKINGYNFTFYMNDAPKKKCQHGNDVNKFFSMWNSFLFFHY